MLSHSKLYFTSTTPSVSTQDSVHTNTHTHIHMHVKVRAASHNHTCRALSWSRIYHRALSGALQRGAVILGSGSWIMNSQPSDTFNTSLFYVLDYLSNAWPYYCYMWSLSGVVCNFKVLEMCNMRYPSLLKKMTLQRAAVFITVLTKMLSGDVLNSAHFVSWVLYGVMGPLNLAHDLQCVICHSDL